MIYVIRKRFEPNMDWFQSFGYTALTFYFIFVEGGGRGGWGQATDTAPCARRMDKITYG